MSGSGDVELLTQRLRLRRFGRDDLPALVAYRSAPEVARYQSWDPSFSPADLDDIPIGAPADLLTTKALPLVVPVAVGPLRGDFSGKREC